MSEASANTMYFSAVKLGRDELSLRAVSNLARCNTGVILCTTSKYKCILRLISFKFDPCIWKDKSYNSCSTCPFIESWCSKELRTVSLRAPRLLDFRLAELMVSLALLISQEQLVSNADLD
jgi:hypothetical protein